ncbi:MAG: PAS domain S-box protein [Spirochaetales bacterium]|nr:PAS domain S-box protein [Spirochaetales bacterium]
MDLDQHIIDSSPIIHFIKDRDGYYKKVNTAYEQILGLPREKIIGKKDEQIFPPNIYNKWKLRENRIMEEKQSDKFEFNLHHEGEDRSFLVFYASKNHRDRDGEEFVGWILEITEHKKSEINLQTILNSLNTGFLLIKPETRVVHDLNRRAEEMIGLSSSDIVGQDCQRFICPVQNEVCPILDDNMEVENRTGLLTDRTGRKIPILKTIIPIMLGKERFILESFTDISEQKEIESSLKRNIEELEKFNKLTINREERMIELKQEVNQLCEELGRNKRYKINL